MTIPTRFLLGCFGLSLVISYLMWCRIRLWSYRQDLFAIRDELWDAMRAKGTLDLPEHRDLRDAINSLVRLAPYLSLPTIAYAIFHGRKSLEPFFAPTSPNVEIIEFKLAALSRTVKFLLCDSLTGRAFMTVMRYYMLADSVMKWFNDRLMRLIESRAIQNLDMHLVHAQNH